MIWYYWSKLKSWREAKVIIMCCWLAFITVFIQRHPHIINQRIRIASNCGFSFVELLLSHLFYTQKMFSCPFSERRCSRQKCLSFHLPNKSESSTIRTLKYTMIAQTKSWPKVFADEKSSFTIPFSRYSSWVFSARKVPFLEHINFYRTRLNICEMNESIIIIHLSKVLTDSISVPNPQSRKLFIEFRDYREIDVIWSENDTRVFRESNPRLQF